MDIHKLKRGHIKAKTLADIGPELKKMIATAKQKRAQARKRR
jgi:hypothetical protein